MILVYEMITTERQKKTVFINFPTESVLDYPNTISYSLIIDKTIKEFFFPSQLKEEEILELIDVLYQIETNELGQIEIPDMLENASTKALRELAPLFKQNIKNGISFINTLDEIKLPNFIIKSLQSAQKGAKLEKTYENIMNILQLKIDTMNKIKKILRYPKMIGVFLVAYFFIIIYYIVPATQELTFMMDKDKFPEISKKLYALSEYAMSNNIMFIVMTLVVVFVTYKILYAVISKLLSYVPTIKAIGAYRDLSLFFSILSSLSSAGVLMYQAINFASEIIGDDKLKEKFKKISDNMRREGGTFHSRLVQEGFSHEKSLMTSIYYGEKSGKLKSYFDKIYINYSKKMNSQIDLALEFINPLTMVLAVAIMIILYAAVNAPLFTFGSGDF